MFGSVALLRVECGSRLMYFPSISSLSSGTLPWWTSALLDGVGPRCLVIAAVSVMIGAAVVRAMGRLQPVQARGGSTLRDALRRLNSQDGTATVEFVLVFPMALFILLILLQTVLMMSGNFFVHYAAFAATRVAIVQAPTGSDGGGGLLVQGNGDVFEGIERSAALAMAPVSGKLGTSGLGGRFASGFRDYFEAYGRPEPNWVDSIAAQRLNYAMRHTDVAILQTLAEPGEAAGSVDFITLNNGDALLLGPKDPVTIGVRHRLHLSIPYASAIFADGTHDTDGGETSYAFIAATCTLTLEGYDRNLPPAPEIDRDP